MFRYSGTKTVFVYSCHRRRLLSAMHVAGMNTEYNWEAL